MNIPLYRYFQLLAFIILSSLIISCDKIDEPYTKSIDNKINNTDTFPNIINFSKKVLLEEYTGFKCQFCPTGAQKALELYDRTAKEGARGEKYPTYGRLPPTPRGGTPSDLSNLGYGTHRDNVTGDAPNSVHFLEELVKMNEQAQR